MNQLDLFRATVAHEPHEPYLFYASFTAEAERTFREYIQLDADVDLRARFGMFVPAEVTMTPPPGWKAPDFSCYFADYDKPGNAFINHLGVLEIPGSLYHFTAYVSPLRQAQRLEDVLDFPYPNVDGYSDSHMKAAVEAAHQQGQVTGCHLVHMYEDAWQIRGYEPFLMDMLTNPDICHYILDRIMQKNIIKAEAAARAGVDILFSGDDVASQRALMFDPKLWRAFIKERWAKVYQAARAIKPDMAIWYHSDGDISAILPELVEIGVTILNPVQPECMDIRQIKRHYGKQLVLDGTLGTQTTLPFESAEIVRQTVGQRKKELGYDGALILSPTHVLEPEVPPENILAFIEACR